MILPRVNRIGLSSMLHSGLNCRLAFLSTATGGSDKIKVELLYDLASPYNYFQCELLKKQKDNWKKMDLIFTPVSIAHLMKASTNQPPAMIPAKGKYMAWDLKKLSEFYQVPLKFPPDFFEWMFETGTTKTQRFMTAVKKYSSNDPDIHDRLVSEIYSKFFNDPPMNITDLEIVKKIALDAGFDKDLIEKSMNNVDDDEIKNIFKQNTDRAIQMGGFGLPMTVLHLESSKKPQWVFGSDRLPLIGYLLGEKNPPIYRK